MPAGADAPASAVPDACWVMPRVCDPTDVPTPRRYRRVLRLAGALSVLACGAPDASTREVAASAIATTDSLEGAPAERTPSAADSGRVRDAERALTTWLDASRESRTAERDASRADSLAACPDGGGAYFPSMLLADYRLRASAMRGDTVVARVEVVTVAEQDIDRRANGFIARERVRRDLLEWDLVPTVASQEEPGWAICNGLRFGYRGADSLTTWRPEGSSWQSARRLADSVRATRPMAPAAIRQRTS